MRSIVAACIVVGATAIGVAEFEGPSALHPILLGGWRPLRLVAIAAGRAPLAARYGSARERLLWSYCARQVGRTMRTDSNGLSRSVTLTDACVRSGGRL